MVISNGPVEFEWDSGNRDKNLIKHGTTKEECEEVFFDAEKKIFRDVLHSGGESRYILMGATARQRLLFIVFTIRKQKIRIISARDLNRKEKKLYEEEN